MRVENIASFYVGLVMNYCAKSEDEQKDIIMRMEEMFLFRL